MSLSEQKISLVGGRGGRITTMLVMLKSTEIVGKGCMKALVVVILYCVSQIE